MNIDDRGCIVISLGVKTTYDFVTQTWGHATMICDPSLTVELEVARKRLAEEEAKEARGEPFDALFVYGVDPGAGWVISGKRLVRVGRRLWKRED